jgi:hypothetical protein
MKHKSKQSRAAKAAITAFGGLQPDDELRVLEELGLMRDPAHVARAAERDLRAAANAVSTIDMSEFMPADGEASFGLPHPDHMTPEQKAQYHPPRKLVDDSARMARILGRSRPTRAR